MSVFEVGNFVTIKPHNLTEGVKRELRTLGLDPYGVHEVVRVKELLSLTLVFINGDNTYWFDNQLELVSVTADLGDML